MTLDEIKSQVMYQTNNDRDDLPDFEPHLTDYINEGYDILLVNYAEQHVSSDSLRFRGAQMSRSCLNTRTARLQTTRPTWCTGTETA